MFSERDLEQESAVRQHFAGAMPQILCFNQLSSVMDLHRNMQIKSPALVLARSQTAGRGQHGRAWSSPDGAMLACLHYSFKSSSISVAPLSLIFGLKIAQILEDLNLAVTLKWPNDILAGSHKNKICGILLESSGSTDSSEQRQLRVGIGLNVTDHPQNATSILSETGKKVQIEELAAKVFSACSDALNIFNANGFAGFIAEWNKRDFCMSQQIIFETANGKIRGKACGVDEQARYLIHTEQGIESMLSGRILQVA